MSTVRKSLGANESEARDFSEEISGLFVYSRAMKIVSKSLEETRALAEELIDSLERREKGLVIALYGDLGTGKTSFAQFIGEALGVHDPIQSPTFLIEKIYELRRSPWQHLIHIDAYRLEDEKELENLGWWEIIKKPENLVLVEWAGKIENILPEDAIHIVLTHVDESTREIQIFKGKDEALGAA